MTDTTGQEATPNTQEGQGQAVELEQSQAEQDASAWTLEKAEARLKELNAENAKWHKRFREVEKAKTDAETAAMAEQGKFKELYQSAKAKADAADALQERLDAITAQAQAANERRIAAISDAMKSLVPEYDDALKLSAWLDANAAVFSRPTPPPLDGRAGGNGTPATVTDEEVRDFATRMRIDPAHVDRAKLAKLKR